MIHFLKPALAWDNHVLSQVQTFFIRGMLQRTSIVIFKQGIGTMIKYYAKLFIYLFISYTLQKTLQDQDLKCS